MFPVADRGKTVELLVVDRPLAISLVGTIMDAPAPNIPSPEGTLLNPSNQTENIRINLDGLTACNLFVERVYGYGHPVQTHASIGVKWDAPPHQASGPVYDEALDPTPNYWYRNRSFWLELLDGVPYRVSTVGDHVAARGNDLSLDQVRRLRPYVWESAATLPEWNPDRRTGTWPAVHFHRHLTAYSHRYHNSAPDQPHR